MPSSTDYRLSLVATILVLLLSSCSTDGGGTGEGDRVLRPTAGWASSASSSSSSADGGSDGDSASDSPNGGSSNDADNFKAGDIVWAWADRYGTNDGYIKAWKLMATGVNGEFESKHRHLWPPDFSDLSIQAFHGDFDEELVENVTPLSSLSHTVSTDQTLAEGRDRSDLLYAVLSPANFKSNLTFMHMLSKVKVVLTDTEDLGGVSEASITGADMSLNDIATTVKLDMETRRAICTEPYADITLGRTTEADHTAEAILPPQRIEPGKPFFTLTLHDFPRKDSARIFRFVAPAEGIAFESGKEYTYTLSVKNLISAKPMDIPTWGWENIENTLQWTKFFFSVIVMDWNGLTEYSHEWSMVNFSPTVEEWEAMDEHFKQWSWITPKPDVDGWNDTEIGGELPKNTDL